VECENSLKHSKLLLLDEEKNSYRRERAFRLCVFDRTAIFQSELLVVETSDKDYIPKPGGLRSLRKKRNIVALANKAIDSLTTMIYRGFFCFSIEL